MKKNIYFLLLLCFIFSGCGFYANSQDIRNEDFYHPYAEFEEYDKYKINEVFVYMTINVPKKRKYIPFLLVTQDKTKKPQIVLDVDHEDVDIKEIERLFWHTYWLIVNDKEEEYREVNKELVFDKYNKIYQTVKDIDMKFKNGDKITMVIDVSITDKAKTERKRLVSKHIVQEDFGPFFLD
jgi:hypothetical protein